MSKRVTREAKVVKPAHDSVSRTCYRHFPRSLWDESEERVDARDTCDEQGESPHHIIAQGVGRMSQNQQRTEPSLAVHHALPIHPINCYLLQLQSLCGRHIVKILTYPTRWVKLYCVWLAFKIRYDYTLTSTKWWVLKLFENYIIHQLLKQCHGKRIFYQLSYNLDVVTKSTSTKA